MPTRGEILLKTDILLAKINTSWADEKKEYADLEEISLRKRQSLSLQAEMGRCQGGPQTQPPAQGGQQGNEGRLTLPQQHVSAEACAPVQHLGPQTAGGQVWWAQPVEEEVLVEDGVGAAFDHAAPLAPRTDARPQPQHHAAASTAAPGARPRLQQALRAHQAQAQPPGPGLVFGREPQLAAVGSEAQQALLGRPQLAAQEVQVEERRPRAARRVRAGVGRARLLRGQ